MAEKKKIVNIIGTGVCGLSIALKIKEEYGNEIEVVITSDKQIEETTSYIAGGLWEPYLYGDETLEKDLLRWAEFTYLTYQNIFSSIDVKNSGIKQLSVYNFTEHYEEPFWKDIPTIFQQLSPIQLKCLGSPNNCQFGYTFLSYVAEPRYFLHWMKQKLLKIGGISWEMKKVTSLEEQINTPLSDDDNTFYDIIINCSGLGSRTLLGDSQIFPVRGQILHVIAPWITSSYTFGNFYLIPNNSFIVIGGTSQKDDWNEEESLQDTEMIWNSVCDVFPSLKQTTIERCLVGLRPVRSSIQLSSEIFFASSFHHSKEENLSREVLVVHCYGMGGCGFTIGPGIANDVLINHIQPFLNSSSRKTQEIS